MKPKSAIPVIDDVDVIVVGGGSGGVAAAVAAAQAGARVFLAAGESYLGEDICGTGQLWLPPEVPLATPLARDVFADAGGARQVPVRPADVKRKLDTALIDAGVRFLFGCAPADLLVDGAGQVAGVVLASRSGLFAVRGRAAIDATPDALLARLAGVPFSVWNGGDVCFKRVVIGHRAEGDAGNGGRLLPARVRGAHAGAEIELEAWEYTATLSVSAWTPEALSEAEQVLRDQTWHKDQTWSSDRPGYVPPFAIDTGRLFDWPDGAAAPQDAFATRRARLFVVGPCAALSREAAARMLLAPHAIAAGGRIGAQAAEQARAVTAKDTVLRALHARSSARGVQEPCSCVRFLRENAGTLAGAAGAALPVLGTFDVVVAGGGTGGAPAAIAAARTGARVLLIETLHGLGGVGTLGCISVYYHGNRGGFTAEVTQALAKIQGAGFRSDHWNSAHKAEWFRRQIREAGGAIWFGSLVSGAVTDGKRVCGVVVNTPWGRGIVRAGAVVDATGNVDVAAAAGAACLTVSDSDLAVQGTGLPSLPFKPEYHNTDYTFVEDSDLVDRTRAFVVARRKFAGAFDVAQIVDSRERRQIVGDVTVTPLDVYTGRTWRDAVCLSRSNFDSHGFTVHPIFLLLPPDHTSLDAWLPLRAMLPRGLRGMVVTGLGVSAQRDVMPVLRMQPDVQNHAYAAGLFAAAAVRSAGGELRAVDCQTLQRRLVEKGILPQEAMLYRDRQALPAEVVRTAAHGELNLHAELAALLCRPEVAAPELEARLRGEPDAERRVRIAKALAVFGSAAGEQVLLDALSPAAWDEGWNYTGMGQYGRSLSPRDDVIVCLGLLKSARAQDTVLAQAAQLDAALAFSHFRAVAHYCEAMRSAACADVLEGLLAKPGIAGHAWTALADELADIPASGTDTRTRNESLRELHVARALYRCGDPGGAARRVLERYAHDLRGHYARHAVAVLAERG